uniref:BACK domain-containing protein n=1 Tax=Parascaris univalens TaxID=6257 RepID=A0A914ZXC9_PARUN
MEIGHKVAYHACVVIGLKMYIAGGYDGDTFFNDFRCYDAERMKWLEMAPMHNARCYVAGCELNGRVFVCGGSDGHERLKSAEIYDTEKNQWTQLRDMHFARSDAAACTMNGRVYVVGGFNGDFVLQSVEMYIPDSDLWIEIATMNTPRSGLACVVDRDSIVIAGGFDGSARLSSVERLRSSSSYTVMLPPMPSARLMLKERLKCCEKRTSKSSTTAAKLNTVAANSEPSCGHPRSNLHFMRCIAKLPFALERQIISRCELSAHVLQMSSPVNAVSLDIRVLWKLVSPE